MAPLGTQEAIQNRKLVRPLLVASSLIVRIHAAYLEPSHVEEELEDGEDGYIKVDVVAGVALRRVQELLSEHRAQEERVNSQRGNLATRTLMLSSSYRATRTNMQRASLPSNT